MALSRLTADEHLADTLPFYPEAVELVDAEGRVLGTFTPTPERRKEIYDQLCADVDEEELVRRANQCGPKGGITTAELLEKLHKL